MCVNAFYPFLQGVPARYTELHSAYPGWLVGKTQVFICPSPDHILFLINLRMVPKLVACKTNLKVVHCIAYTVALSKCFERSWWFCASEVMKPRLSFSQ